ncbi:3-oxoacyl-[acyl-carrier protein] reductase [Lentisphaera araneosa HTCC2155]|jgi:3-oxoacyl-[acyl-carrier protein] reductase|uniref:3-oxoacyl-[acyl-carrier protein] reductase n=1 Tax=Lentisphaera araneosa HTCC2155 TaxID=313628 RepID=A6DMF4_9BACT|nr:3-oxoacyl-ACP reductase FabG [Lentisphaera araneosa]EDM27144.1 3-oxoacyl-[acyl-carrier protein] reductase [Lentisphaera araneosa HTCC2155]
MQFKDQNVIVTGGTRGIGKGIAENFLKQGANVLVTYSGNKAAADEFLTTNEEYKDNIFTDCFNVADASACEEFFERLPFEKVHVLVNNAGIRKDNIVAMMPKDDWQQVLDINLTGTFNMCKAAVMKMSRQRYGRIVNITSPCSHFGFAGQANYAASKAGQIGLTRSLSKEVAKRKITVNCISPGFIGTDLIADLPEKLVDEYKQQIPMKRFGTVDEVANGVSFLASEQASYITGTVLEVSGGL